VTFAVEPAPTGADSIESAQATLVVTGVDKEKVGRSAANLRSIRAPEPYKGKGIRYSNELVRLKPGKSAVA
jgi:large subunit ribosomal protein L6